MATALIILAAALLFLWIWIAEEIRRAPFADRNGKIIPMKFKTPPVTWYRHHLPPGISRTTKPKEPAKDFNTWMEFIHEQIKETQQKNRDIKN